MSGAAGRRPDEYTVYNVMLPRIYHPAWQGNLYEQRALVRGPPCGRADEPAASLWGRCQAPAAQPSAAPLRLSELPPTPHPHHPCKFPRTAPSSLPLPTARQDIANQLRGPDMIVDFDQIFAKRPQSGDSTFDWHQDQVRVRAR